MVLDAACRMDVQRPGFSRRFSPHGPERLALVGYPFRGFWPIERECMIGGGSGGQPPRSGNFVHHIETTPGPPFGRTTPTGAFSVEQLFSREVYTSPDRRASSHLATILPGTMSNVEDIDSKAYEIDTPAVDEKHTIGVLGDDKKNESTWVAPEDWYERLKDEYSGRHELESLPPGCDPDRFARAILTMNEHESVEILVGILNNLHNDYTFDLTQVDRMKDLIQVAEHNGLEYNEWAYQVCKMAGIFHNWSAYLEVRSCTLPYDDVEEPCETFRAYLVGFFWVIVMTAVNTCEWTRDTPLQRC